MTGVTPPGPREPFAPGGRWFEAVLEAAPESVVVVDHCGRIVRINDQAERLLGYSRDELVGEPVERIVPLEGRQAHAAHREAGLDLHARRKDGVLVPVDVSLSVLDDPSGPFVIAIVRDVSERRQLEAERRALERGQAQEALRLASDDYRQVVETARAVIWRVDTQTLRFAFVSREAETLLGYPLDRWTEDPGFWENRLHPADRSWAVPFRRHAAEARLAHELSYRMVDAAGRTVWVQDLVRVVSRQEGAPELVGVTIDITERMRAREEAQASETRYWALFEDAHDIIYLHDLAGRLISVNRAAEQALGHPREVLLGLRMEDLVVPEHRGILARFLARDLTATALTTVLQLDLVSQTGCRVPVEVALKPVLEGGRPVAIQGIARDLTERRQLEAQLREAQRLEGIGRLAGGMAHDFNNLLTVVAGRVEMLRERLQGDPEVAQDLDMVQQVTQRAAGLIRQLLAFSRRQTLQPRVFDLAELIRGMGPMLRPLVGEDVELVVAADTSVPVKADPGQIEQVVLNLVVNARDAMPRGGRLTLRVGLVEAEGVLARQHPGLTPVPHAALEVADTGMGMDEATRLRVFEPFFTTKAPGVGTGLGLSTVYGIVKQHEGAVAVQSAPREGTTFTVYLPRADDAAARPAPRLPGPAVGSEGSETILLVEDQPSVRTMVRDLLSRRGYTVLEAADPAEALRIAEGHERPIDLLLADVVMPQMRGPEVAEHVVRLRPGIAVLYVSGYADDAPGAPGALPPGAPLLQKPFTGAELARAVREVLGAGSRVRP